MNPKTPRAGARPATVVRRSGRTVVRVPAYILMGLIWVYQRTLSPMLGDVCRYYPSCSHYGYEAISVHGAAKGTLLTARRLARCTPFHAGGLDAVPAKGRWRVDREGDAVAESASNAA